MIPRKRTLMGLGVIALAVMLFYAFQDDDASHQEAVLADEIAPIEKPLSPPASPKPPEPLPAAAAESAPPVEPHAVDPDSTSDATPETDGIDPVRLAQAELALVNNQIYEEVARETLPTLSIQTHNPVWALEYAAEHGMDDPGYSSGETSGPLPAPRSGPFGNIQPPEGEIWLRIPPDFADEHRDIMAENADLYRVETGYSDPVTITLWVGGRPYTRQQYE